MFVFLVVSFFGTNKIPDDLKPLVMKALKKPLESIDKKSGAQKPGIISLYGMDLGLKKTVLTYDNFEVRNFALENDYIAISLNQSYINSSSNIVQDSVFIDPETKKPLCLSKYIGQEAGVRVFNVKSIPQTDLFESFRFASKGEGCEKYDSTISQICRKKYVNNWLEDKNRANVTELFSGIRGGVGALTNTELWFDISLSLTSLNAKAGMNIMSLLGLALEIDPISISGNSTINEYRLTIGKNSDSFLGMSYSYDFYFFVRPFADNLLIDLPNGFNYFKNFKLNLEAEYSLIGSPKASSTFYHHKKGVYSDSEYSSTTGQFGLYTGLYLGMGFSSTISDSSYGFEAGVKASVDLNVKADSNECSSPPFYGSITPSVDTVFELLDDWKFYGFTVASKKAYTTNLYKTELLKSSCIAKSSLGETLTMYYYDYQDILVILLLLIGGGVFFIVQSQKKKAKRESSSSTSS